ncbi:MAG: MucB/RseB C-terminal domain-containing protein [Nitrosomonadales bacterium]|nr:MucB/RseB C-terminal domain-containing protein [Nitrosomonadales bacterium]
MRLAVALGGMLLALAAHAAERTPLGWLEVAAIAGHHIDYNGVFVYQYDNRVETANIIHLNEANSEYEKLVSLDGPKREIIRHDGRVWNYTHHMMIPMDSQQGRSMFPSVLPGQLSALGANYQAKLLGEERVAGYNAQVILFKPRDNLRYTHKMWVHTDSGLLLKSAVLGDKEQVAEQYAFTQLQIGGKIDRGWIKECNSAWPHKKNFHPAPEEAPALTPINSGWVADRLPAGFKKTQEILRPMQGKHAPVTQIVFSDGLSAISIFIEPNDQDEDDVDGLSSRGEVSLYRKVVNQNLITVVGEVPPRTVMQVLDSVRFNGK